MELQEVTSGHLLKSVKTPGKGEDGVEVGEAGGVMAVTRQGSRKRISGENNISKRG